MNITGKKIKEFFVPKKIILKILRRLKRNVAGFTKAATTKYYDSYDDALKDCPTQKAYENKELCFMIGDKTKNFIKTFENKPYILNATNIFLIGAIQNYFLNYSTNKITILDFGGACGLHYYETRRYIPKNYNIKWFVAETEEMVDAANKHGLENEELKFINNIENENNAIDLVYSSCALQYVPNWKEYLNKLIEKNAKYMLFNRMMFNENDKTFITLQMSDLSGNGPGPMPEKYEDKNIFYPHTTISYKEFNKIIMQNGYNMEWCFEEQSGSRMINNEKIIGRGMLYKKGMYGTSAN